MVIFEDRSSNTKKVMIRSLCFYQQTIPEILGYSKMISSFHAEIQNAKLKLCHV
jgi:hypothetical protein